MFRKKSARTAAVLFAVAAALLSAALCGCAKKETVTEGDSTVNTYRQIDQEEAKRMMEAEDGCLVVDVRRPDEFAAGHIPGAVNVPNEEIGDTPPAALPDREQILLVYCRSGRRSKEASEKLFALGYRKVYEFGGILDWTGETVKDESETAKPDESRPMLVVETNGARFYAVPEENSSAAALIEKLSAEPLTLTMADYGGFEKVGALPWSLPANDERITTKPGDIILYQGDQITVYYGENTWSLTKLASIPNATRETLFSALSGGDAEVRFSVEWGE